LTRRVESPNRSRAEIILVATSATNGAKYAVNVPEVVDAPAQSTRRTNLAVPSQADLNRVSRRLNERPRR
jgi:hypothetical protein